MSVVRIKAKGPGIISPALSLWWPQFGTALRDSIAASAGLYWDRPVGAALGGAGDVVTTMKRVAKANANGFYARVVREAADWAAYRVETGDADGARKFLAMTDNLIRSASELGDEMYAAQDALVKK